MKTLFGIAMQLLQMYLIVVVFNFWVFAGLLAVIVFLMVLQKVSQGLKMEKSSLAFALLTLLANLFYIGVYIYACYHLWGMASAVVLLVVSIVAMVQNVRDALRDNKQTVVMDKKEFHIEIPKEIASAYSPLSEIYIYRMYLRDCLEMQVLTKAGPGMVVGSSYTVFENGKMVGTVFLNKKDITSPLTLSGTNKMILKEVYR